MRVKIRGSIQKDAELSCFIDTSDAAPLTDQELLFLNLQKLHCYDKSDSDWLVPPEIRGGMWYIGCNLRGTDFE